MPTENPEPRRLPSTFDTLTLKVRFVIEELRRLRHGLTPEDVIGEVPGLDEAIEDCKDACCDYLRPRPKEFTP